MTYRKFGRAGEKIPVRDRSVGVDRRKAGRAEKKKEMPKRMKTSENDGYFGVGTRADNLDEV